MLPKETDIQQWLRQHFYGPIDRKRMNSKTWRIINHDLDYGSLLGVIETGLKDRVFPLVYVASALRTISCFTGGRLDGQHSFDPKTRCCQHCHITEIENASNEVDVVAWLRRCRSKGMILHILSYLGGQSGCWPTGKYNPFHSSSTWLPNALLDCCRPTYQSVKRFKYKLNAVAVAKTVYENMDPLGFAVLADVLEEADCIDKRLLNNLRDQTKVRTKGNFVLTELLGNRIGFPDKTNLFYDRQGSSFRVETQRRLYGRGRNPQNIDRGSTLSFPESWATESQGILDENMIPVPIFHRDDPNRLIYENMMSVLRPQDSKPFTEATNGQGNAGRSETDNSGRQSGSDSETGPIIVEDNKELPR